MRADGLTVGQALDRDAAQLRALGIDARDGARTFDEQRDEFTELVRKAVLDAMDEAAEGLTGSKHNGPKDGELAKLFAGIDPIAERIYNISIGL